MNSESPSVTKPSAKTPIVCVTVTIPPSSSASRGRPRVPTRYAVTIAFPWPGVSAWAAPQNIATRSASATTPKVSSCCSMRRAKPPSEAVVVRGAAASEGVSSDGTHHVVARCEPRFGGANVQWARESILRIGAETRADPAARCGRALDRRAAVGADHELAPAEPFPVDGAAHRDGVLGTGAHLAGGEDELEARRAETCSAWRKCEPPLDHDEAAGPAVDRDGEAGPDRLRQPVRVALAAERRDVATCLEGRDLGEVEDVVDVGAIAGEDDLGVVIRGEVPERMRRRDAGRDECRDRHCEDDREALHAAPSLPARDRFGPSARAATGAQRIEKLGSSASALRYHPRIASRSPAHPAA